MEKETLISRTKELALSVVQTEIDSIRSKDIERTGIRVYKDGKIGIAGKMGKVNEQELTAKALENLAFGLNYPYPLSADLRQKWEYTDQIISEVDFVQGVEEILAHLRKSQPEFSFSYKAYLSEKSRILRNSCNLDLEYHDKSVSVVLLVKDKASSNIIDGVVGYTSRKFDANAFANHVDKYCNAFANLVELPAEGDYPVIFTGHDSKVFSRLISDLNGLSYGAGSSLLSGKIGQKIFNDNFSLYQYSDPKYTGGPFFDDEGIVNKNFRYDLIRNGELITPYTDKKFAAEFDLCLTGAASSAYDGIPSLDAPDFAIESTGKTLKELISGERGILVSMASGGDFTPEGAYATPVQVAFLVENGEMVGRLPQFQVSSHLFKMFGDDFVGRSSDKVFELDEDNYLVLRMKVSKF